MDVATLRTYATDYDCILWIIRLRDFAYFPVPSVCVYATLVGWQRLAVPKGNE